MMSLKEHEHKFWHYSLGALSSERQAIMGFSILWIMFFHSSCDCSNFPVIAIIKQFGNLGVDIFLLLSGIGLYYSADSLYSSGGSKVYFEEHYRDCEGEHNNGKKWNTLWIIRFYQKRIIRILPATIICLLPWYLYLYKGQQIRISRFLLNISSLSYWIDGTNRGWYVALTIVLYAFYPFVFIILRKWEESTEKETAVVAWKKWIVPTLLIITDIIFNTIVAIYNPTWFEMVNLAPGRVPIFVAGCFLAQDVKNNKRCKGLPLLCVCIGFGLVTVLIKYIDHLKSFAIWRYLYGIIGFCAAVLLSVVFYSLKRMRVGVYFRKFFFFFWKVHT